MLDWLNEVLLDGEVSKRSLSLLIGAFLSPAPGIGHRGPEGTKGPPGEFLGLIVCFSVRTEVEEMKSLLSSA